MSRISPATIRLRRATELWKGRGKRSSSMPLHSASYTVVWILFFFLSKLRWTAVLGQIQHTAEIPLRCVVWYKRGGSLARLTFPQQIGGVKVCWWVTNSPQQNKDVSARDGRGARRTFYRFRAVSRQKWDHLEIKKEFLQYFLQCGRCFPEQFFSACVAVDLSEVGWESVICVSH